MITLISKVLLMTLFISSLANAEDRSEVIAQVLNIQEKNRLIIEEIKKQNDLSLQEITSIREIESSTGRLRFNNLKSRILRNQKKLQSLSEKADFWDRVLFQLDKSRQENKPVADTKVLIQEKLLDIARSISLQQPESSNWQTFILASQSLKNNCLGHEKALTCLERFLKKSKSPLFLGEDIGKDKNDFFINKRS